MKKQNQIIASCRQRRLTWPGRRRIHRRNSSGRGKKNPGLIFVVSGPSGSGKSTLLRRLLKDGQLKERKLIRSISFTTRPKRTGERDKKDYFFISAQRFRRERQAKKILEWTRYLGYYYATPKVFIEKQLKAGRHILLCLDLRGALRIKRLYPKNSITIFVMPPSLAVLRDRIKSRCQQTLQEEIQQRLALARKEIRAVRKYNYFLMNKDLPQAAKELKEIILKEIDARSP